MKRFIAGIVIVMALGVLLTPALQVLAAPQFADDAFARVWNREDRAVFEGVSGRSWTWGPENLTPGLRERFVDGQNGERLVQYFDKSRMEINDPNGNEADRFYVTNGLLPIEMMTGRMQVGFETFEQRSRANIAAIGDPGNFPTYADLSVLYDRAGSSPATSFGRAVTSKLNTDSSVDRNGERDFINDPNTVLVASPVGSDYGVPAAFANFMVQSGFIFENNEYVSGQIFDPLFVFGLPVTEPFWVDVTVGGETTPVLFQVFERRVITYNPANEADFRVEMGNVGAHYYEWRYGTPNNGGTPPTTEPLPTVAPTEEPYPAP